MFNNINNYCFIFFLIISFTIFFYFHFKLLKNNKIDNYYLFYFLICSIIIFSYGKFRTLNIKNFKDPLEINFLKSFSIDGWSLTHLLFYMLIGFQYPNSIYLTMTSGILWELFETYVGYFKPSLLKNFGFITDEKMWWYGKFSDIIINFIGFKIGKNLKYINI